MKKYILKITLFILPLIFFLSLYIVVKTKIDIDYQNKSISELPKIDKPEKMALRRFSGGLKYKTVNSINNIDTDFTQFKDFIKYIKNQYSDIFTNCNYEIIGKYGILIKIEGKDKEKKPNLLITHYDVEGVQDEGKWEYSPFSGYFDEEYIYSRGTLDNKGSVFAVLEALKSLMQENFQPEADVYIMLSNFQEAALIKGDKFLQYFKTNKIKFNTILNSGGRIINKNGQYFAKIGVAHKGKLLAKITVKGEGGNSCIHSKNTAVKKLSKLINAFSDNNSKTILIKPVKEYYKKTFSAYKYMEKIFISNINIFRPIFSYLMIKNLEDNARMNTTYSITMLKASKTPYSVSDEASMILDVRIIPSENIETIKKRIEKIVKKTLHDKSTEIEYLSEIKPYNTDDYYKEGYQKLSENISNLYQNIIITPDININCTQIGQYAEIAENVLGFMPIFLNDEELEEIHNNNEKISQENWARMINFYKEYISNK